MQTVRGVRLVDGKLEVTDGGHAVLLPAGPDAIARIPHIARSLLVGEELEAFELLAALGLGCAGVVVREK